MKLLRGLSAFRKPSTGVVATIGNFDGVHLGHQGLLRTLKQKAQALQLPLMVILFEPQPLEYFLKDRAPPRLSSLRDKLAVLKQLEVDYVYCLSFNERLAFTKAQVFAKELLFSRLGIKYLLVGEDFRFGQNKEGDVQLLKSIGQQEGSVVESCPHVSNACEKVSSTRIRDVLQLGQLTLANTLLGRTYSLCGRVIKGDGRGRLWGIPTANVLLKTQAQALRGVFVVEAQSNGKLVKGVANLGRRPTVDGSKNSLEVHLFDFDESIYGDFLQVFFLHKLRDEVKFTSVEALIDQIHQDIELGKAYFHQEQRAL